MRHPVRKSQAGAPEDAQGRTVRLGVSVLRFPTTDPHYLGFYGEQPEALDGCDLVVAVGCRVFYPFSDRSRPRLPPGAKLIHVHPDASELGRLHTTEIGLAGDVSAIFRQLTIELEALGGLDEPTRRERSKFIRSTSDVRREAAAKELANHHGKATSVARIASELGRALTPGAIVVEEAVRGSRLFFRHGGLNPGAEIWRSSGGSLGWGEPGGGAVAAGYSRCSDRNPAAVRVSRRVYEPAAPAAGHEGARRDAGSGVRRLGRASRSPFRRQAPWCDVPSRGKLLSKSSILPGGTEMNRIRRTLFATAVAAVIGIVSAVGAGAASPGTVSVTQHGDFTSVMQVQNPCTGSLIYLTLNTESVFHMTYFTAPGANEFWITGTDADTASTSPDPANGVTYSGHGADWFGGNLNQNNTVMGSTFNLHLTGTDGSRISAHFLMHVTVASFGPPPVVTSNINVAQVTCS